MNKKQILLVGLAACTISVQAADDFGTWTEMEVTKKLPQGFDVTLFGELRSFNSLKNVDRWSAGLSFGYEPFDFLSFGLGYSYLYSYKLSERKESYKKSEDDPDYVENEDTWNGYNLTHAYWLSRNRLSFDITGKTKCGRISFSLRERYQYTSQEEMTLRREKYRYNLRTESTDGGQTYHRTYTLKDGYPISDPKIEEAKKKNILRSRFKMEYNIRHFPVTPYLSCELYNSLDEGGILDKVRYSTGVELKINKQNKLSLGYCFQTESDDDVNGNIHVVNIAYSYKF